MREKKVWFFVDVNGKNINLNRYIIEKLFLEVLIRHPLSHSIIFFPSLRKAN